MSIRDKGTVTVRLSWESGSRTNADINNMELVYTGKYDALLAIMPEKGAVSATGNDIPDGYKVETAALRPRKGLLGTLTITLVEIDASATGGLPPGALRSTIEIDMAQLEKPILTKSAYSGYAPAIDLWRNEPDVGLRSQYKYHDAAGAEQTLSGEALKVAALMLKGVESYISFNPVVTRNSIYDARPAPSGYGKISTPPVTVSGTWVYLKTADRIIQQTDGKYQRTEQWTGADEWSPDLYENA